MPAEKLRDQHYKIDLAHDIENLGNRTITLILNDKGDWVDIPCASDTQTLRDLVSLYFKPNLPGEIGRLTKHVQVLEAQFPNFESVFGVGAFLYGFSNDEVFEVPDWVLSLQQHLQSGGYQAEFYPTYLSPSVDPARDEYLDQNSDPKDFRGILSLINNTYILCPAITIIDPDLAIPNTHVIGYQAAVGIDGDAILGLLKSEDIHSSPEFPGHDYVYDESLKQTISKLIE